MVSDKIESDNNENSAVVICSAVFELFLLIVAKMYVESTVVGLEKRAVEYDETITLAEIIVVPFQLAHYILKQAVQIMTQSFSVLVAFKIVEIQPSQNLPLLIRVSARGRPASETTHWIDTCCRRFCLSWESWLTFGRSCLHSAESPTPSSGMYQRESQKKSYRLGQRQC